MKGTWLVLLLCQGGFAGPQWVSITIPGLFEIYGCEYTTSYPRTGYRISVTLDECKQSCLTGVNLTEGNNSGCLAVEWHQTTGWCNFYTNLCNTSVPTSQEGIIMQNDRIRPWYKFYVNANNYYPVTCTLPHSQVGAVKCIDFGSSCLSIFDGNASVSEHYKLAENSTTLTGYNPNCSSFPNPLFGSTALNPCDVLGCVRNGSSGGYQAHYYGAAPVPTTATPTLSLAPTSPTTRVPTSPAPTGATFPLWTRVTIPGLFADYGCEFTTNFSRTGYRINITLTECKQACLTGTSLTEGTNLGCRGIEWHNRTGWCNLYTELCNSSVTPTQAPIALYDGRPRPFYRYYGDPNNFYYITCILPHADPGGIHCLGGATCISSFNATPAAASDYYKFTGITQETSSITNCDQFPSSTYSYSVNNPCAVLNCAQASASTGGYEAYQLNFSSFAPTTPLPSMAPSTAPTTRAAEIDPCSLVQAPDNLEVACIPPTPPTSGGRYPSAAPPTARAPTPTTVVIVLSPLFNITAAVDEKISNCTKTNSTTSNSIGDDGDDDCSNSNSSNSNGTFQFVLPLHSDASAAIAAANSRPCGGQPQVSCEWQDPATLEFRQSGCVVSRANVPLGGHSSSFVGVECTCTHLTVFAIVLRSELQVEALCQAQEADYVLLALYSLLAVCLLAQLARLSRAMAMMTTMSKKQKGQSGGSGNNSSKHLAKVSLAQHSLLLVACVLRVVYLVAKPVIGSLAGLVLLGLLPSAATLSLFIHLLLVWTSLQLANFSSSPFARFRVPFLVVVLLVLLLIAAMVIAVGTTRGASQIDAVTDGSYVLAALYAVVCVLVLLSGLGLRGTLRGLPSPISKSEKTITTSSSSSFSSSSSSGNGRRLLQHRVLVATAGLSVSLFAVACLWVAAVQTDIITSSALTLATTTSFYVFDWLSLCVMTWLLSKAVASVASSTSSSPAPASSDYRPAKSPPQSPTATNTAVHDAVKSEDL